MMYKKGLVIGKFMPPHKGHEYLFRFAKQYCQELTVVVDCLEGQTISPELRKSWIEELVAGIKVIALNKNMPQSPEECENFWEVWREELYCVAGKPDVLIAAMDYGWDLAKSLDCEFVQCDIARESVPISATEIRDNPFDNWEYLVESARGHFLKKICFIGPESTGKSTLAKSIAKQFNTIYVPEYAKAVIDSQNGEFYERNVLEVARAQVYSEKALERMTNKIMVCDTDCVTTMVWSEILFKNIPDELIEIAKQQKYDLTFLMYPDTSWVDDTHRKVVNNAESQEFRLGMFYKMEELLKKLDRNYVVISGSFKERENLVMKEIKDCFFKKKNKLTLI